MTAAPLSFYPATNQWLPGPFASVEDWRGTGGDSSDTGAIQAAVDNADGEIALTNPTYTLEDTIRITRNNVVLVGQGEGGHQNNAATLRASAATRLIATTAEPMILWTPVEAGYPGRGGGIRRVMLDGMAIATRCLDIRSWRGLHVDDMHLYAATQDMLFTGAFTGTLAASSVYVVQWCEFHNVQAHAKGQAGNAAYPARLTGGQGAGATAGGNTCYCLFENCMFLANDQDGILMEDTDSNTFVSVTGSYDVGTHHGLVLGSADQDSSGHSPKSASRYNSFFGGTYKNGVFARASQIGGFSSFKNCFYGKTTSNGEPNPTIEAGAGGSDNGSAIVYSNDGMEGSAVNIGLFGSAQTLTPFSSVIVMNAAANNRAVTLPKANAYLAGKTQLLYIGRNDTSNFIVAISAQGTDTINGLTTINIGPGPGIFLYSDGISAWFTAGSPMMRHGLFEQSTEAGITLSPWLSPYYLKYSATQTAPRTVTLSTTGAVRGMAFKIIRTGAGASPLNIGTGPLTTLSTGQWCEVIYDGTAWVLAAVGGQSTALTDNVAEFNMPITQGYVAAGTPALGVIGVSKGQMVLLDASTTETWGWTMPPAPSNLGGQITSVKGTGIKSTTTNGGNVRIQIGVLVRSTAQALGSVYTTEVITHATDAAGVASFEEFEVTFAAPIDYPANTHVLVQFTRLGADALDTYPDDWGLLSAAYVAEAT